MKKKIIVFISVFVLLLFSVFRFVPVARADSSHYALAIAEYSEHTNTWSVYAIYNENTQQFLFNDQVGILVDYNEDETATYHYGELVYIEYEFYTASLIQIISCTNDLSAVNSILTSLASVNYDNGYTAGTNATYSAAYNQGYDNGYDVGYDNGQENGSAVTSANYVEGATGYNTIYQAGYDSGKIAGYSDGYSQAQDDGVTDGSSFYTMLKTIALYPVEIFTIGLNVDLFGVNVGGFLLGIFMVAIVLALLRMVKGG